MKAYLDRPDVKTIAYDAGKKCYTYCDQPGGPRYTCAGLHGYLERTFYPHLARATGWRPRSGGGSSKRIGQRVDRELVAQLDPLRAKPVAKLHEFTRVVLAYFAEIGHRLCAAQVLYPC